MANFFDQFDEPAAAPAEAPAAPAKAPGGGNFFDQFDEPVKDLPAAGVAGDGAAAVGRGIINGIPVVGPSILGGVNRGVAAIRTLQNGTTFPEELKKVEGFGEGTAKANPWATTGGEVLGGVAGTLPLVAAAPAAFGASAAPLLTRTAASTVTGAVLGGADTAARTEADPAASVRGAATGAAFGAAGPVVGKVIGYGARTIGEMVGARSNPVPGMNAAAAGKLTDDLRSAGGVDPVRARLTELGPDAMLLDASPSFEGRAQGLAVLPDTREAIVKPLTERAKGANGRLARDLDSNVGPATDPATFTRTLDTEYERVVPPLYAKAFAAPVEVDTKRALNTINRLADTEKGGASSALSRARELLMTDAPPNPEGITRMLDTRPEALHNAKEALDAMIATVKNQQGSAAGSELRALSMTRASLNGILEEQVPGYAMANRTAQKFFKQGEAFKRGQQVLNGGREAVRPAQLAEETAAMAPEVAEAQRAGLRSELDLLVGTTANDRVALQKAVKGEGDYNRSRLATVFGEEPTAGVVGAVDREKAFDAAHQRISNNSMTELRKRAADDVAPRDLAPGSGDVGMAVSGAVGGPVAAAGAAALKGLRLGANAVGREADIARNQQLAQAVTMIPGDALEALLEALGSRAAAGEKGAATGEAVDRLVQALLQSQGDRSRRALPSGLRGQ